MSVRARAALKATLVTAAWALLMLVPFVSVICLIVFMLPLWALKNLGVPGLGHELHGFFVPSTLGWALIAVAVWLLFFSLFHWRLNRARASDVAKAS